MALAMKEDVALDPVDIRLLGPAAVVACANGVTNAVEELRLRRVRRSGLAEDRGGRRARGGDDISDRPHRGPSLHRTSAWTDDSRTRARTARTIVPPPRLSPGRDSDHRGPVGVASAGDDAVLLHPELRDPHLDHVAGLQIARGLHAVGDAGRGAGRDQVARAQRHALA